MVGGVAAPVFSNKAAGGKRGVVVRGESQAPRMKCASGGVVVTFATGGCTAGAGSSRSKDSNSRPDSRTLAHDGAVNGEGYNGDCEAAAVRSRGDGVPATLQFYMHAG